MISTEIAFLLILASAIGGPWLATIVLAKAKRNQARRNVERQFAKHFPPLAQRRPKPASETQTVASTVKVADEKPLT
jgi:hypothetical protein